MNAATGNSNGDSIFEGRIGAFSPTAMHLNPAMADVVKQAEEFRRNLRKQFMSEVEAEAARASEARSFIDHEGSEWTYVVFDDEFVRIDACKTQVDVLCIPQEIDGKPVREIAPKACSYLSSVREINCPDSISSMGNNVFRGCKNLRKAKLSTLLNTYDSSWFGACDKLEALVLPTSVERLEPRVFDNPSLRSLHIGAGTSDVAPGTFAKSKLEVLVVDEASPHLKTDGKALYSKDGTVLLALCMPVEEYNVADGCTRIASKAFSGFDGLKTIGLPDTLEVIEPFAFWSTSISQFNAPSSLRTIGEKAFFNCRNLEHVSLNEGLQRIDCNAFTGTRITALHLPSSIEKLGNPLASAGSLVYAGPDATVSISDGGNALKLDNQGGLYRQTDESLYFVALLDPEATRYEVREGVQVVGEKALAGHESICEIILPNSLREIKSMAFKGCNKLTAVNIPDRVTAIGDEAFLDTNIQSVYLPSGLETLGSNALLTQGAHYNVSAQQACAQPALRDISVGEGNSRFLLHDGLLLERTGNCDTMRVLLCTGTHEIVRIPPDVNEIAPYAFNNVKGIRELHLSDRISTVGIRGLAIDGFVELIHIDLATPQDGRTFFELRFPDTECGIQQTLLALSIPDHVSVETLFSHYDAAITYGNAVEDDSEKGSMLYRKAKRLIDRLQDPVMLSTVNRQLCERFLSDNIDAICVAFTKHEDRGGVDALLDLGYINADNIYDIIGRISVIQDAEMTNYLLQARRERFELSTFDDFDL